MSPFSLSNISKLQKDDKRINAKYIKGYDSETFMENIFSGKLGTSDTQSKFGALFGFENKEVDPYDPYTTADAKKEHWWKNNPSGRVLYPKIDEDVNEFRNVLFRENSIEQYEDPTILGFEISFDTDSPFFDGGTEKEKMLFNNDPLFTPTKLPFIQRQVNSLGYFLQKYGNQLGILEIENRFYYWKEFKEKLFTIFKDETSKQNIYDKPYYINKISGLRNLNKKIIKYGEDKITISLNEDVRMLAMYLSELYNNLVYSYKDKRMMIPENLLRFDMNIKISDMRNFTLPTGKLNPALKEDKNENFKYEISPKSTIMFTLHDCSFDFFDSYNFQDDITMAGYRASMPTQSDLEFNIIYKSVTRWSNYPLLNNKEIVPWEISSATNGLETIKNGKVPNKDYYNELQNIKTSGPTVESKGFWNNKLTSMRQTVSNAGLNYIDNLETHLREERGQFVNDTLNSFRNSTGINKMEPDNVYSPSFNNRIDLNNAKKSLAADLLNDLSNDVTNITNF
jgi:hypothetical protein